MVADYYGMLGVPPDSDRGTIEAALAKCQPEWSSKTRHPSKGTLYQSYLDQVPAIRRTLLGDPAERAAYDAERASVLRIERDQKLDALQRLVRLRAAKGGLTVSDRSILRTEASKLGLENADLDRLMQPFPPMPEAPATPAVDDDKDPPIDVVEPATRRQIRVALDHLNKHDLYDLLGLRKDAPASEITARAAAERQRWMQKAQVTAEKTAWLNAVSLAQSHLGTPEGRARYDRTLGLQAEEEFTEVASFVLTGLARLDDGTRQALVTEATAVGIPVHRAQVLIRRASRKQGIALEGGPAASVSANNLADRRWLRCPSCSGLTEYAWSEIHGSGQCRHCQHSLQWDCPVCRRQNWSDDLRCRCGFEQAHLEPLIRHFEAAQTAHRERRYAQALDHLERVREFAPRHIGARKGIEKVEAQLDRIRKARAAYDLARARNRLVAARSAAEVWGRLVEPNQPEVQSALDDLGKLLEKAARLTAKADAVASTDPGAARAAYRQALAIAADLPEAVDGLRRCPPDGPTDLRAEVASGRVRLRWSAPRPDGVGPVKYRILRKRQARPEHRDDGVVVAETDATEWQDADASAGLSFGYAVFSIRNGSCSLLGVSAGPFVVAEDVRDVRMEARKGEVRLSWIPPEGALGVRVVRKPGAPVEGPRDGVPISAKTDGAIDSGLDDGRVYHYGIFALYKGPDGFSHPSPGVYVSAIPQPPSQPVEDLRLAGEADGRLRLSWSPPAYGRVKILRTEHPLPFAEGDRRSAAEADRIEGVWLDEIARDHAFDAPPAGAGLVHYTPITFSAGQITVGKGVVYSHVADPTDLRVARAAGESLRVLLRWRWNPQGGQCLVVARAGRDPSGPNDPEALTFSVDEAEYARNRHFSVDLPHSPDAPWHLVVYTVASIEGKRLISSGLEPSARAVVPGPHPETTVSYDLRPPLLPGRKWSITLRTDPAGVSIPPTVLVAHARTIPLAPDDGRIVARFPASKDGQTHTFRPARGLGSQRLRLFLDPEARPEEMAPIRLRHPETGATRV